MIEILAQWPVGADQLNEGSGVGGWISNILAFVGLAYMYIVFIHPD